ncbi:MAG: hypothetical protein WAL04_18875 [Acidimicrobiales bacterium]
MTIKATALTSGQSTPASVGNGKPYRWNGHADWTPNHPAYREPKPESGPALQRGERAARLREFAGYIDQGLNATQAGRLVGIAPKTARSYLSELLEQRREAAPDA